MRSTLRAIWLLVPDPFFTSLHRSTQPLRPETRQTPHAVLHPQRDRGSAGSPEDRAQPLQGLHCDKTQSPAPLADVAMRELHLPGECDRTASQAAEKRAAANSQADGEKRHIALAIAQTRPYRRSPDLRVSTRSENVLRSSVPQTRKPHTMDISAHPFANHFAETCRTECSKTLNCGFVVYTPKSFQATPCGNF